MYLTGRRIAARPFLSGYVSSGRCEKIDLETRSNFGLEKTAPGCLIGDCPGFGIHFGSDEISLAF
jgi:hypothetical protein